MAKPGTRQRGTSSSGAAAAATPYRWEFRARFRRHAFGWRSHPAVERVKQAVAEIKTVARHDRALAAEGAVLFLERVSPALEQVDSSSGAIGTAVHNAICAVVPIIAEADVEAKTRAKWLERLWDAHEADQMPCIESLADFWGELCGSEEVASEWADRLVAVTTKALSPDPSLHGYFHGTSACLSALYRAGRYDEIVEILDVDTIWPYKAWAVRALAAMGKKAEALRYAEACRSPWASDLQIDAVCEEILLSSGMVEEAYRRYGLRATRAPTYLATFRAISKKYPDVPAARLLADLVATTPGQEAKWFAAAKDAGLYDEALVLAGRGPCDPKTLTRAARDFADKRPAFARDVGLLALRWLIEGYGYDVTSTDVWAAYTATMTAAGASGGAKKTEQQVRELLAAERPPFFVTEVLRTEFGGRTEG